jgi:hypothetical protein
MATAIAPNCPTHCKAIMAQRGPPARGTMMPKIAALAATTLLLGFTQTRAAILNYADIQTVVAAARRAR